MHEELRLTNIYGMVVFIIVVTIKKYKTFTDIEDLLGLGDKLVVKSRKEYDKRIKSEKFVKCC
jgi:hypothetical protein